MNLLKATGTIGGLTMVSRIAGFGREMLMSRVMGASWQADAFFVAFRLPNINVRPQGLDEATANTDDDKAQSTTGTQLQKEDLFEYVDTWGNPIVYLSAADYKDVTKVEQYVLGNGTAVKVVALKNETTGEYIRPDSFQLYSMGPDGKPGTDDDLVFGK